MNRKQKYLSFITATLLASSVYAQNIDIQPGWNLLGSSLDNVSSGSFSNSNILSVWGWDS